MDFLPGQGPFGLSRVGSPYVSARSADPGGTILVCSTSKCILLDLHLLLRIHQLQHGRTSETQGPCTAPGV